MDVVANEALDALSAALESLLPPDLSPSPSMMVNPARIVPTGLGGFVGLQDDPLGEIIGRRLDALVTVNVETPTADLAEAVMAVTSAFLAADRTTLRGLGILRMALDEIGSASSKGNNTQRDLSFSVLFEYLKRPEENGGVISEIPVILNRSETSQTPLILFNTDFMEDPLDGFEIVDDPKATQNKPSKWQHNTDKAQIEQRASIRGGSNLVNANKPGAYLVLRTTSNRPLVQDFILTTTLRSDDDDGIGVVFRWQDVDNFYFFLMSVRHTYRMVARKIDGAFESLNVPALDDTQGYTKKELYEVKLEVQGANFSVHLDDILILQGSDTALPDPGRVGFMCRANNKAFFSQLSLIQL